MKMQWIRFWPQLGRLQKKIKHDFKAHQTSYILLSIILLAATFFRMYRTGQILGFYYDQGRDAIQIWELIHKGDFFLIGPTTGIAGIFRGPFYYYLITPVYWLSAGDPVWPANFLALTTVIAIGILFYLVLKVHSRAGAILAVIIASFSFKLILDARWLSNPTPMLLLSMLLVLCMFLILNKRRLAWIPLAFISGISLFHFGSSGEFFYFPALAIFALWQRKSLNIKIVIYSIAAFLITALPLIVFDLKNNYLLANNIRQFFFNKDTFKQSFWEVMNTRLEFYWSTFSMRIFQVQSIFTTLLLLILVAVLVLNIKKFMKKPEFRAVFLLFLSPLVGLLFFQGNEGNIYDYYLTGYYFVFVLLVGVTLGEIWKTALGKTFVIVFISAFLLQNLKFTWAKVNEKGDTPHAVVLANQKQALEWIYTDAAGQNFNIDVYVPPVIPYAYDYLFAWYPTTPTFRRLNARLVDEQIPLLYTLYEVDPPHPERLEAWQARQAGIAKVEHEKRFGGITVERRQRLD